ncbi:MAG: hypothetical protein F6K35_36190 [Okeania sp. SIO2H7]|nr:hypothetical protein [Okeania sp. SIO2H7]
MSLEILKFETLWFPIIKEWVESSFEDNEILKELEIKPGISVYLRGRKVTKSHGFGEGSIIAKWKRKYRGWSPEEAWFILTNL